MSYKLLLDIGHYGTESGATGNGYKEADLTKELCDLIVPHMKRNNWSVTTSTGGDVSTRGARAKGHTYALSIHFNAGGGIGTEVMVPCKETGAATAVNFKKETNAIAKNTRSSFARSKNYNTGAFTSRPWNSSNKFTSTVNATDWFGFIRGAWAVGVSADILEVAFIDNKEDISNYVKKKKEFARAIAKAVVEAFGGKFVEEPTPTPTPPPATSVTPYRVRKSWADAASQVGAYNDLDGAKKKADETKLNVYDNTGKEVYKYTAPTPAPEQTVPKATYDAVVKERDTLKTENASLKTENTSVKNENTSLKNKVEAAKKALA
ncbi:MAG: N-acetylmuramoyl-L-alanine amidase [Lentisphaeria bacterium]